MLLEHKVWFQTTNFFIIKPKNRKFTLHKTNVEKSMILMLK